MGYVVLLAVIVTDPCPATNNRNNLKSPMWGWVFISEMRLWYSWYDDNGHGDDDYVLSDIIINIAILFLSLFLFSWSK